MEDKLDAVREYLRTQPAGLRDRFYIALAAVRFLLDVLAAGRSQRRIRSPFLGAHLSRSVVVRSLGLRIRARARSDDLHNADPVHKPAVARWFRPEAGEVVIDIGAHIGLYSMWASQRGATVVAVEPHPETFEALQMNLRENHLDGLIALNVAVDATDGERLLFDSGAWSSVNSLDSNWAKRFGAIVATARPVKVQTLDHITRNLHIRRVDWLLIDAEGAESGVLTGGHDTLRTCGKVIMEVEDEVAVGCERLLNSAGLAVVARFGRGEVNSYWLAQRTANPGGPQTGG